LVEQPIPHHHVKGLSPKPASRTPVLAGSTCYPQEQV